MKIKISILAFILAIIFPLSVKAFIPLPPIQGGTGIGTAVVGDIGKVLTVSNNSPFTYTFSSPAGLETDPLSLHLNQTASQTITNGQPIWNTLTASQLLATDANKKFQSLDVATYPSLVELSYVKGVTSGIQAQLNTIPSISNLATKALDNLASVAMNAPLQWNNSAAQTLDIASTANTVVGRALTISAGSTVTGGTADMAGGDLTLKSGVGKGTGASSIHFFTGTTLGTGSTLQTLSEKMTILGSGNVGIGTTNPLTTLAVQSTTNTVGDFITSGTTGIDFATIRGKTGSTVEKWALYGAGNSNDANLRAISGNLNFQAGGSVTQMVLLSSGNVGIGTTSPSSPLEVLSVIPTGNLGSAITVTGYGSNTSPELLARYARGTVGSPTAIQTGDTMWQLASEGYNGSAFSARTAYIQMNAEENWTTSAEGTNIVFATTQSGGTARSEKMRITGAGNVGIGTTAPSAVLHLKAGTATASTAPIKLTSGVVNTTAETGALEYNGTNLSFVPTGTLRENIFTGARGNVTLTAGTTTTVTVAQAKTTSTIMLTPTSLGATSLSAYVSTKSNGSFVITTLTALGTETMDYLLVN